MADRVQDASNAARQAFTASLSSLVIERPGSDFTLVCGEQSWSVHLVIIQIHSKVLHAACLGQIKKTEETEIDLFAHDQECIEALIQYLYTFDYLSPDTDGYPIKFHVKMVILAEEYDILPLKTLAFEKLKRQTSSLFDKEDFAGAISWTYEARKATKEIRSFLIDIALREKLFPSHDLANRPSDFENAMRQCPDLAVDISMALIKRSVGSKTVKPSNELDFNCWQCDALVNVRLLALNEPVYFCPYCGCENNLGD